LGRTRRRSMIDPRVVVVAGTGAMATVEDVEVTTGTVMVPVHLAVTAIRTTTSVARWATGLENAATSYPRRRSKRLQPKKRSQPSCSPR
jgi:hypothetical protein